MVDGIVDGNARASQPPHFGRPRDLNVSCCRRRRNPILVVAAVVVHLDHRDVSYPPAVTKPHLSERDRVVGAVGVPDGRRVKHEG